MLLSLLAATALAGPILPPPDADELEKLEREEEAELERLEAQDAPRQKKEKAARGGPIKSYELAFRGRAVSVPRGILNGWFHAAKDEGWPIDTDRPDILAGTYGLELSMIGRKSSLALVYVEALQSFMKEGYWDDREDGEQYFNDGKWIRPSKFFGAVVIGANGVYDAVLVRPDQAGGKFSMGFQVGGGLGLAIKLGSLDRWGIDTTTGTPAYVRKDLFPPEKAPLWPVYPVPDLSLGFRFTFADVVTLKLEAGLHGGFFYGGTLGGRF
jgi:hypothetical protein